MIFRTAWGYAAHRRNFLLTMLRLGAERDELRVVAHQVGSPTSAAHIADTTAAVLAQGTGRSGLWHLTCAGQTSWHGFAEAIMAGAVERGLPDKAPKVLPIHPRHHPTPHARPAFSGLYNTPPPRHFALPAVHGPDSPGPVVNTTTGNGQV